MTTRAMGRIPADAWVALVLLVASGFFLNNLLATEGSGAFVKTTTLPTALVLVLIVLSLILLGGSLLRPAERDAADTKPATEARAGLLRVAAMLAWTVVFIAALPWLGYLAASVIFLIGANLLYGNRRPLNIGVIAIVVPLALLLFFEKFM
ncbi:MAG: tripartite tricarboxylate transporter TctB family protein, partial [Alphaproteobacteria bacterium]